MKLGRDQFCRGYQTTSDNVLLDAVHVSASNRMCVVLETHCMCYYKDTVFEMHVVGKTVFIDLTAKFRICTSGVPLINFIDCYLLCLHVRKVLVPFLGCWSVHALHASACFACII